MENSGGKLIIRLEEALGEIDQLDIEFDLYTHIYVEALKAILETIEHNALERGENSSKGDRENYVVPLERSNIVAFIGGRGAGKTTAINEFGRLLGCFADKQGIWKNKLFDRNVFEKVKQFYVLPPIDASVLGAKEDLIEVILASMYQEFREKEKKRRYRDRQEIFEKEINNEFDRAYKNYIDVARGERPLNLGETVLVKLNNVSNSLKTRVAFDRLIKDFLRYMHEDEAEKTYLVITIDDLDMNPENGYEMLEQLHKYLENLRVIVLIAVKHEQIDMISQKHFVDCLIPEYGSTHVSVYNKFAKEAKRLSNDYLLKVLPLANRIYLPEKSQLYLEGKVSYKETKEKERPVKEFILEKIASKMDILYDADGLKKHFCLPDTVRELVSYVAFLDSLSSMKEIEAQKGSAGEQVKLYDKNHERFNKDIEDRMAPQLLNDEQLKQYQLIMGRNIERRAEYTVNFVKAWINNKVYDSARKLLSDRVDENNYCYADLLETLYYLGREDYEDKVLVHCILASFTSEMVREYYSYQYNTDAEAKQRARNRLKCFRGKTFGGRWFDEIIPIVIGTNTEIIIGDRESFSSRCKKSYQEKSPGSPLGEIKLILMKGQEKEAPGKIAKIRKKLVDIVPYMECLSLLFYDFRGSEGRSVESKWRFKIDVGETSDGKEEIGLTISNEAKTAEFDFLGFIGKELEGGDTVHYGRGLHQEIVESLQESIKEYLQEKKIKGSKRILRNLEEEAKKNSIWANNDPDKEKPVEEVVFPFYNLDMSYNIMKRVKQKVRESTRIKPENFCEYIRGIYGYIALYLKSEEDYYNRLFEHSADKKRVPKLYDNFVKSPFIKAFGIAPLKELTDGKEDVEGLTGSLADKSQMNEMLMDIIMGLDTNVISDFQEHDEME